MKRNGFFTVFGFLGSDFLKAASLMKFPGDLVFRPQIVFTCHERDPAFCGKMLEIPVQRAGNTFTAGPVCDDDAIDIYKIRVASFEPEKVKTGVVGPGVEDDKETRCLTVKFGNPETDCLVV